MTTQSTQVIVRFIACYGNLQRLEFVADRLVVDGALFGDYTIINVDTAFATPTYMPMHGVGDRVRQDFVDFLTCATPLEACQAQVDRLKDDLYLAHFQMFTHERGSSARQNVEQYIEEHKALLAIAETMLSQQLLIDSREHYFTTSDFIIQIDQPMVTNDGALAGTWTLLAGNCPFARFIALDPQSTDDCLEGYALWPVRVAYQNDTITTLSDKTVAMNQQVFALVEQAVAAKGMTVEPLAEWYPANLGWWDIVHSRMILSRPDMDKQVENLISYLKFGGGRVSFTDVAAALRRLG